VVAVGVNKAADQYVVLDERTKKEMARPVFVGLNGGHFVRRRCPASEKLERIV
jgi:hypothetical protein